MSEMMDLMKNMVVDNGDEVGIDEPVCVLWKSEHSNCKGCPSGLGCAKYIRLGLVFLKPMIYTPKDFDDHLRMSKWVDEQTERVLKATSEDELKAIEV